MSEIRRLSLILNQNSKQSHNAFKKILNKSYLNDCNQENISNLNNSGSVDLKPWIKNKNDSSRFDWQTNPLKQEFTNNTQQNDIQSCSIPIIKKNICDYWRQ